MQDKNLYLIALLSHWSNSYLIISCWDFVILWESIWVPLSQRSHLYILLCLYLMCYLNACKCNKIMEQIGAPGAPGAPNTLKVRVLGAPGAPGAPGPWTVIRPFLLLNGKCLLSVVFFVCLFVGVFFVCWSFCLVLFVGLVWFCLLVVCFCLLEFLG